MQNNTNFFSNLIRNIKNIFLKKKNKDNKKNNSKKKQDDIYPLF